MSHTASLLILCFLLVSLAGANPVVGGYGNCDETGRCEIVYCERGFGYVNDTCMICTPGWFSDEQTLNPCIRCSNKPHGAFYTSYGEKSSKCAFRCERNLFGMECLSLYSLWPFGFILIIIVGVLYWLRVERQSKAF